MHKKITMLLPVIVLSVLTGCKEEAEVEYNYEFHSPQAVVITGYNGHTMEPFITRDDQYLFFNNSNEPTVNTNLHYAQRVDDTTFQYMGEINGVNSDSLDGVASMDDSYNFYFITTRSYFDDSVTVYQGVFDSGTVANVKPAGQNLALRIPGWLEMDAEVSPAGDMLYFSRAYFTGDATPDSSDLFIAVREGSLFVESEDSDSIMQNINTRDLEYAASITSDGLELFFTRADLLEPIPEFSVMVAKRSNVNEPFGTPQVISAIEGEATEAPSITSNGNILYFHKQVNGVYAIYLVRR